MRAARRDTLAFLAAATLLACGPFACAPGEDAAPAAGAGAAAGVEGGVECGAERGPVRMRVTARPARLEVGEIVMLEIDVSAEAGVEVRMPVIEAELGPFSARPVATPPDVPDDDRRRWVHRYALDTFAAGDAEIPAIAVEFTDRRASALTATGDAVEATIESEPLAVRIDSVLAADVGAGDFRDIRGEVAVPVPPEQRRRRALLVAAAALLAVIALAVAAIVIVRRGRRAPPAPPPIPADVWARAELAALADAQLIERGRFHDFYFRLSDIVRQYIVRRFALMAPDRTTDEFLRELGREDGLPSELGPAHRERLGVFLRAADLVKFARHEPGSEESRAAFDAALAFVEETRAVAEPVEAAA